MNPQLLGTPAYRDRSVYRWQFQQIEVVAKRNGADGLFSVEILQRNKTIAKTSNESRLPCLGAAINWAEQRLEDLASDWLGVVKAMQQRQRAKAGAA